MTRATYIDNQVLQLDFFVLEMNMDVQTTLEFLKDLPLYEKEQPYFIVPRPDFSGDPCKLRNIEWESQAVTIHDARKAQVLNLGMETTGFQTIQHVASHLKFQTPDDKRAYCVEIETCLKKLLNAEQVICYDCRVSRLENIR